MGGRTKIWFLLVLAMLALVACGEDTETVRVTDRYTPDMLGKGVSLTEEVCDSARVGQLLYVGDSSSIYYCTGKAWKKINGKDGKDGRDGTDGADGADGKRGRYGVSGTDCFIDNFSEGFVLGCGATKAVIRYDFKIPDTCRIALRSDSTYVLTCGNDSTALLQGGQGDAGDICKQTDIGGGQVRLVCGNDSVTTYKAQCGETPFDPDGTLFCYGDTLVERCNTHAYDIKKQFCYSDSLVDMCGGGSYDLKQQFCYGDSVVALCGGMGYDLTKQFCYGDTLIALCGGNGYDLAQQFCYSDSLVDLCGGKDYNLTQQFCYSDSLVDLCAGWAYDVKQQFCHGDTIVSLCGGKNYNLAQQFCYNDSLVNLCGGKDYDLSEQFCFMDSLVNLCRGKDYDLAQQFCYNDSLIHLCGGNDYNPKQQFCAKDSLANLCGNSEYNWQEQFCYGDSIVALCGGKDYDIKQQFCFNDSVAELCGGWRYNIYLDFCYNDSIPAPLCDGKVYDLETQFCLLINDGMMLLNKCSGETYNPFTHFCYNDSLVKRCNGEIYDLAQQFCYNDWPIDLCGGHVYDLTAQFCYEDQVVNFCGGEIYDLSQLLCINNKLYPRYCEGKAYDTTQYFCYSGKLVEFCGGETYNPEDEFCYCAPLSYDCPDDDYDKYYGICRTMCDQSGDTIVNRCGGKMYDPKAQTCENGIRYGTCAGRRYSLEEYRCYKGTLFLRCPSELGEKEFCDRRNGRVYKYTSVGGQDWMAENLDYRVPESEDPLFESMSHSFCAERGNDYDVYCGTKGRYYPWHVAMAQDVSVCGEGHECTSATSQQPVRGVCPRGWHLPSWREWQALIQTMGEERNNYWDKSVYDVYYKFGTDPYGFSAIMTGILSYRNDGNIIEFPSKNVDYPFIASYWSSSENWGEFTEYSSLPASNFVYAVTLDANPSATNSGFSTEPFVQFRPVLKQNARTVRCVKDEATP